MEEDNLNEVQDTKKEAKKSKKASKKSKKSKNSSDVNSSKKFSDDEPLILTEEEEKVSIMRCDKSARLKYPKDPSRYRRSGISIR